MSDSLIIQFVAIDSSQDANESITSTFYRAGVVATVVSPLTYSVAVSSDILSTVLIELRSQHRVFLISVM